MGDTYQSSTKLESGSKNCKHFVWREIEKNLRKKRRETFVETPYSDSCRNISVEIGKSLVLNGIIIFCKSSKKAPTMPKEDENKGTLKCV